MAIETPTVVSATKEAMLAAGADPKKVNALSDEAIFNGITRAMPANYQRQVGLATAGFTNIVSIGQQITANPDVQNAWVSALINRIGMVLFNRIELTNRLAEYKRGLKPNGRSIEELAIDSAKGHIFNPKVAETELYKRIEPQVASVLHTARRDMTYGATFQGTQLNDAFNTFAQLDEFVTRQIRSMVNGNASDEFYHMKLLLSNAVRVGGIAQEIPSNPNDIKSVQKSILKSASLMQFPNRAYNKAYGSGKAGIETQSTPEDLRIFMTVETSINLDIDFFAQVFNLGKAEAATRVQLIDYFPDVWEYESDHTVTTSDLQQGYLDEQEFDVGEVVPAGAMASPNAPEATKTFDGSNVLAIVGDKAMFQVWDEINPYIGTQPNAMGRYLQAFLQVKQIMSFSQLVQSVAVLKAPFDPDAVSATGVTVSPKTTSLKVGDTRPITATVTPDDATNREIIWSSDNENVATVDENGLVTGVEKGTANIKATTVDGSFTDTTAATVTTA